MIASWIDKDGAELIMDTTGGRFSTGKSGSPRFEDSSVRRVWAKERSWLREAEGTLGPRRSRTSSCSLKGRWRTSLAYSRAQKMMGHKVSDCMIEEQVLLASHANIS